MTSLKKKALSGLAWTFAQQFSTQGINFVISVILARLLLPEDFGILGMLAIFMALGNTLMDAGMSQSLVRSKEIDQDDYSTVFFINLIVCLMMYVIMVVSAPWIAAFFNFPILKEIIPIYCLSFIIKGFGSIQKVKLTKEMNFKLQMTITVPSLIVGGLAGIYFAYNDYGVWSLVYFYLIQSSISTVQLWIRSKWTPSFVFNKEKLKEHFNFGYKITLSSILETIFENSYNIIIAKFFSASQLGFYTRAQSMKQLPVKNISTALNRVTFPLFAIIQDDVSKLKDVYRRLMQQVLFWIAPTLMIAGVLAEPLFRFLLTEKWLPAVPFFQILCFVGIMYPLHAYNLNILKVKGRSDLFLKLEVVKKIIIAISILIAIPFGIYGLLWGQVLVTAIGYVINTYYSGKLINYSIWAQLKDLSGIFFMGILAATSTWFLDTLIKQSPDLLRLVTGSGIGFIAYFMLSYFQRSAPLIEFRQLVFKR